MSREPGTGRETKAQAKRSVNAASAPDQPLSPNRITSERHVPAHPATVRHCSISRPLLLRLAWTFAG